MKILTLAACTLFALTSCTSTPADEPAVEAGVINSMCALQPDHEVVDGAFVDYKGYKIGMCCENCVAAFPDLTDAQKDEALAQALK